MRLKYFYKCTTNKLNISVFIFILAFTLTVSFSLHVLDAVSELVRKIVTKK